MPLNTLIDRGALSGAGVKFGNRFNSSSGPQKVYVTRFTATLAEINAGKIIKASRPDQMIVLGLMVRVVGNFATMTDLRLSDLTDTPVDIATIPVAQLTDGAKLNHMDSNVTLGAGFDAPLTPPNGLKLRQTGTAGTGGTSVSGWVMYTYAVPRL